MKNYVNSIKYIGTIVPVRMTGITKVGHLGESVLVLNFQNSVFVLSLNDCAHGHFTRFNEAHLMTEVDADLTYWASIGSLIDLTFGETPFKHITPNRGKLQVWKIPVFGNSEGYRNLEMWEKLTQHAITVEHIVKFSSDHLRSYQEIYEPQKLKPRNPPR